jgi:hypothetical protein
MLKLINALQLENALSGTAPLGRLTVSMYLQLLNALALNPAVPPLTVTVLSDCGTLLPLLLNKLINVAELVADVPKYGKVNDVSVVLFIPKRFVPILVTVVGIVSVVSWQFVNACAEIAVTPEKLVLDLQPFVSVAVVGFL